MRVMLIVLAVCALNPALAYAQRYVWWEGENPTATNFPERTWFDPQNDGERDKLSNGDWLTHIGQRPAGSPTSFARYTVDVPHKGQFVLWVRKMWKHGPFRWRFDGGPWRECGRDIKLADSVTLRTHVPANWVCLGDVQIKAGQHRFEIELLAGSGQSQTAGFDCFMLIDGPFMPRGKLTPGESSGRAEPGWFAFEPGLDPFNDDALLDLRSLNEAEAGEHGALQRDGDRVIRSGDGEAVKLWGANVSASNAGQNRESVDYLARKLAKLGFNAVRYHSPLFDPDDPSRLDREALDDLQYLVHAMNQQGIYVELSTYFPLWFNAKKAGLAGFDRIKSDKPFALVFFDPAFQKMHRGWIRQMLTAEDPYSGKPLARNPGVAIVEIVNEDSLFFWTFSKKNIPPVYWQKLEPRFAAWIGQRYGSAGKAYQAWGGAKLDGDHDGRMAVREAWFMTGQGMSKHDDAHDARMRDQVRFLAELQRGFYSDTAAFIRSLGYKGMIAASNWQTADAARLDRVERWTYAAADVIDRHAYVGGRHQGEGSSYSVRVGHTHQDVPLLNEPARFPVQAAQVHGYPQIVSELGWTQPNRYRTESLPVSAAYAAYQGIDGLFFFAVGSNYALDQSMTKFQVCSPAIAFNSPAAAILYRRGDVLDVRPSVFRRIDEATLFSLEPEQAMTNAAFDELRKADLPAGVEADDGATMFLAGPVLRDYHSSRILPGSNQHHDVRDPLKWDAEGGHVVVNTPRARGIIGHIKRATPIDLGGVVIQSDNVYGSVLVIALDERPLERSKRLLIQAMTEDKPHGFKVRGGKIADLGSAPFNVRRIDCTITLPGQSLRRAVALDANGYRRPMQAPDVVLKGGTDQLQVTLEPTSLYHIIER